jgi:hypothetical protein
VLAIPVQGGGPVGFNIRVLSAKEYCLQHIGRIDVRKDMEENGLKQAEPSTILAR